MPQPPPDSAVVSAAMRGTSDAATDQAGAPLDTPIPLATKAEPVVAGAMGASGVTARGAKDESTAGGTSTEVAETETGGVSHRGKKRKVDYTELEDSPPEKPKRTRAAKSPAAADGPTAPVVAGNNPGLSLVLLGELARRLAATSQSPHSLRAGAAVLLVEELLPSFTILTSFMLPHLATSAQAVLPGMPSALAMEMQRIVSALYVQLGALEEYMVECAKAASRPDTGNDPSGTKETAKGIPSLEQRFRGLQSSTRQLGASARTTVGRWCVLGPAP